VERDIDPAIDVPHDDLRILIFIAVRELLFNVVKHSTVKRCWVELGSPDPDFIRVAVRDHGIGFDDAINASPGFGLFSLRERLELMGGKLEIHSKTDQGVEAVILAPRTRPSSRAKGEPITRIQKTLKP